MHTSNNHYSIRSKQQMRALAAAARQEIMDILPPMGTVSVAELAAALGRPADSLYYHLRILKKAGLVISAGHHKSNGRREALFRAVAPEMSLCYEVGKKGNGKEINAIIASMLRLGIRDFGEGFASGLAAVSGPERELWALRKTGWLSQQQVAEVNQHMDKILQVMAQTSGGEKLYSVTILLTPLERNQYRLRKDTE